MFQPIPSPVVRIFVSSPGDVAEERVLTQRVISRLAAEFAPSVRLEGIFWEHEPLLATDTFQTQIMRPSEADVVLCILWSRLGTRLPPQFTRPDGSRYDSGTEFEFEDAAAAHRERGRPDLLVYRKTSEPLVSLRDEEALLARLTQKRLLDGFIQTWFHSDEGSLTAAFHPFDSSSEFEAVVEAHLRKLIARHLAALPAAEPAGPTEWTGGSPFRGLEAFDVEDGAVFFGRSRATGEVLDALRRRAGEGTAFVLLLGMSGGGKSSLVRAGVLPMLTAPGVIEGVGTWRTALFKPSDSAGDFRDALAAALREALGGGTAAAPAPADPAAFARGVCAALDAAAGPASRLAVVVDQMEEIFTADAPPAERDRFVEALGALAASGRVWVLGTLRSDFYARCEEIPALVELKSGAGQYHVLPPSPAEIGQMIRGPVRTAGLALDEDPESGERLEDLLRDAAVQNPASLPLLEFTLEELYKRRAGNRLTLAAYRELGGVEGALATRTEALFGSLPAAVRAELPRVLRELVHPGDGSAAAPLRARAPLAAFEAHPAAAELVRAFVEARLFVTDQSAGGEPVVSVAHEALLVHWPRVGRWLAEDGDFLRLRARLESASATWAEEGESPDFLLAGGKPLAEGAELLRRRADLSPRLVRFLEASLQRDARARRRRTLVRGAVVASAFAALGSVSLLLWGLYASEREQRREALALVQWVFNETAQIEPLGTEISPQQATVIRGVFDRLAALDFRGTARLTSQPGRFLVVGTPEGGVRERTGGDACTPAAPCETYPEPRSAEQFAEFTIRTFSYQLPARTQMRVVTCWKGADPPWFPYPDSAQVDAWNEAARRNHRVRLELLDESGRPAGAVGPAQRQQPLRCLTPGAPGG
jgi:hypothetical protein